MKRFLVLLSLLSCGISYAATETINWYVDGNTYATTTCQTGGDITLPTTPTKYGYTFQGWNAYTLVEYIESTGTQYIDTRIVPNQDYRAELVAQITADSGGEVLMGSRVSFDSIGFTIVGHSSRIHWASGYGSQVGSTGVPTDLKKHVFKKTPTNFYIDGESLYTYTNETFTAPGNLYLFGSNNNGTFGLASKLKVWSLLLYNNDTLVRDFIPVLDSGGTPCLYDRVSDTFFYNAGTGQFIAGPVINQ